MTQPLALIIDDEPDIRELLALTLGRMEIACRCAADITQAKALLGQEHFDLCLTDMRLPDGNGIELVEYIQANFSDIPTAVITAHGNMESAVQALKAGAFDFVSKPVDLQALRSLVTTALKLSHKAGGPHPGLILLGNSTAMQHTRATIAKLARSQAPVYISGESGTGKELAARLIHEQGPRSDKPFVPVNCGAIPEALMESEFFGHKKGSFTGAISNKEGLFQAAHGGTLFLDEVADLPLHMQVKLLRAIQEKAVRPVGEQKEIPIDVRILSATHKDLATLVKENAFRQDLFYRINVIELHVPALRERTEDIPLLVEHILRKLSVHGDLETPHLTDSALMALMHYPFPGNVRELENILERAMTLCEHGAIQEQDLRLMINRAAPATPAAGEIPLEPYLGNIEKETILRALEQAGQNKTAAARLLGISFGALRYRLKKLGLE
jgi:two-component system response regulator PilR (NtrC family)